MADSDESLALLSDEESSIANGGSDAATAPAATAAPAAATLAPTPEQRTVAALVGCGDARLRLGDLCGAYEDYREAARIEPTNMAIWQKYEETYRSVERTLEKEHEIVGAQTVQEVPSTSPLEQISGPPPNFSFLVQSLSDTESLDTIEGSESSDRADSDEGGSGVHEDGEPSFGFGSPSTSRNGARHTQASSQRAPKPPMRLSRVGVGQAGVMSNKRMQEARVELVITNRRTFGVTMMAWNACICMTIYFYLFKNRTDAHLLSWYGFALVVLPSIFTWAIVKFSKRRRNISVSLSDILKLFFFVMVMLCVLHFYVSELGRPRDEADGNRWPTDKICKIAWDDPFSGLKDYGDMRHEVVDSPAS